MNDTRKPREFWISGINFDEYTIEPNSVVTGFITANGPDRPEAIHVIEYSAYEALEKKYNVCVRLSVKNEALRKERDGLQNINKDLQNQLQYEIEEKTGLQKVIVEWMKERDEYRAALEHFASIHQTAVPYQDLITGEGSVDKLRSILSKYPKESK